MSNSAESRPLLTRARVLAVARWLWVLGMLVSALMLGRSLFSSPAARPRLPPFDEVAVKQALDAAAERAAACGGPGRALASGRVQLDYAPGGSVLAVHVLTRGLHDALASCVRLEFERAGIPAYHGGVVKVLKGFGEGTAARPDAG